MIDHACLLLKRCYNYSADTFFCGGGKPDIHWTSAVTCTCMATTGVIVVHHTSGTMQLGRNNEVAVIQEIAAA